MQEESVLAPECKIYIDESGNLGEQGRFFSIAAVVVVRGKRIKNLLKRFCAEKKIDEIKNRLLSFSERQDLLNSMRKGDDHYVSYICLDKSKIREKRLFKDKNVLFNYLLSYLLKPIVKRNLNTDIHICIDNRSLKITSTHSLADYIKTKAYTEWDYEKEIFVSYADSKKVKLIQAADIAAGVILEKYKLNIDHFYEKLFLKDCIRFPHQDFNT